MLKALVDLDAIISSATNSSCAQVPDVEDTLVSRIHAKNIRVRRAHDALMLMIHFLIQEAGMTRRGGGEEGR
jgi:hypothetical protein